MRSCQIITNLPLAHTFLQACSCFLNPRALASFSTAEPSESMALQGSLRLSDGFWIELTKFRCAEVYFYLKNVFTAPFPVTVFGGKKAFGSREEHRVGTQQQFLRALLAPAENLPLFSVIWLVWFEILSLSLHSKAGWLSVVEVDVEAYSSGAEAWPSKLFVYISIYTFGPWMDSVYNRGLIRAR